MNLHLGQHAQALALSGVLTTAFALNLGCFGCGSEEPSATGTTSGNGTTTGQGGSGATSSSSANSSSTAVVATTGTGAGGSGSKPCEPAPGPDEFYARSDTTAFIPQKSVSMCDFRGEVVLVVNTAAL